MQFVKFFVGGILYSARGKFCCVLILWLEPEVERYFKQFGKVVDVAIMRDKHTGRSRGFAFVTFEVYGNEAVA
jgi:hypothetical protein